MLHFLVSLCISLLTPLWLVSMSSCTPSPAPSAWIESVQRLPFKTIEIEGYRIAYLEAGRGPTLILIHGFGGSMWNWEYQYTSLASHHRVITLDLLGSGSSEKPDIPYTPQRLVQFFRGFMDELGIKHATLAGNSMGAGLAMAVAITYPERIEGLILISGFPANPRESVASPRYQQFFDQRPPLWMARFGLWVAGRWATQSMLKEIVHDPALLTPLVVERSYQNRLKPGFLPPLYSLVDHLPHWEKEFGRRIQKIQLPTLILWGAEDQVFPPAVGKDLHNMISNSTFHTVPDAGHMPQWEQPLFVNNLIRKFLTESQPDI